MWNVIMECEGQTKPVLVADWVTEISMKVGK